MCPWTWKRDVSPILTRANARNERTSMKVSARRSPPSVNLEVEKQLTWTRGPSYMLLSGEAVCQRAPRRGGRTLTPHCTRAGVSIPLSSKGGGSGTRIALLACGYLVGRVELHISPQRGSRPMSLTTSPVCVPAHEGDTGAFNMPRGTCLRDHVDHFQVCPHSVHFR